MELTSGSERKNSSGKETKGFSLKKRKNRDNPASSYTAQKEQVTGAVEYEHNHKKLVRCLVITMLIELSVFGTNLTCVAMTPWFHDCNFYNGEVYTYTENLTNAEDDSFGDNGDVRSHAQTPGNCSFKQSTAYCSSENIVNSTLEEVTFTCRCTDFYDTVTLWDKALTFHDSVSKESVAWPVRGLISFAVLLKFLVTFEYFICLVSKKMRESPSNYMVKFCSSWLSGAFLLGSTMHISFSDYSKMCNKFGIGFWTMVVSFIMLVPSMIGVLFSAGYFVHLRTLKMEMKQK